MNSQLGVDIKFNEYFTLTVDWASVSFHSSGSVLSRKISSEMSKVEVEIAKVAYHKHTLTLTLMKY